MRFDVVTIFPEMINSIFNEGIIARAIQKNTIKLNTVDIRQFSDNRYQSVDDRPYGGGPGMLMTYEPIQKALQSTDRGASRGYRIYLSPQGKKLDDALVNQLSCKEHIVLLCGRYEGVDERIIEDEIDLECSIGDYVISGGELAAAVVIDSVSRKIDSVLGHRESSVNDSYASKMLDYPHYTRPETIAGKSVPAELVGGNHRVIDEYRLQQSLGRTWLRKPELFAEKALSEAELCLLNDFLKRYRNN